MKPRGNELFEHGMTVASVAIKADVLPAVINVALILVQGWTDPWTTFRERIAEVLMMDRVELGTGQRCPSARGRWDHVASLNRRSIRQSTARHERCILD
jgi:hypothetical protein